MATKIFADSEEKFLTGIVLYANSTDGILYYDYDSTADTAYTNKVSKADLINLFKKGAVIVDDGSNLVRPTVLTVSTNYATVTHTTVGASDIAVATAFHSDGYTAS